MIPAVHSESRFGDVLLLERVSPRIQHGVDLVKRRVHLPLDSLHVRLDFRAPCGDVTSLYGKLHELCDAEGIGEGEAASGQELFVLQETLLDVVQPGGHLLHLLVQQVLGRWTSGRHWGQDLANEDWHNGSPGAGVVEGHVLVYSSPALGVRRVPVVGELSGKLGCQVPENSHRFPEMVVAI